MDALKIKLLSELLSHLQGSQGKDLKSLMDLDKNPIEGSPEEEAKETPDQEALETGKPKGIAIEKVSIMGKPKGKNPLADVDPMADKLGDQLGDKPSFDDQAKHAIDEIAGKSGDDSMGDKLPGEEEMSDSELEELLKKYLS